MNGIEMKPREPADVLKATRKTDALYTHLVRTYDQAHKPTHEALSSSDERGGGPGTAKSLMSLAGETQGYLI